MDIKDAILTTLEEIEELSIHANTLGRPSLSTQDDLLVNQNHSTSNTGTHNEVEWLERVRERLLVLFEGLQAPNNAHLEAKIDLTLNFLEYLLATVDHRLDIIKK